MNEAEVARDVEVVVEIEIDAIVDEEAEVEIDTGEDEADQDHRETVEGGETEKETGHSWIQNQLSEKFTVEKSPQFKISDALLPLIIWRKKSKVTFDRL